MISTDQMQGLLDNNAEVVDSDGDKVGKIGQVYLDDTSGNPEWVTVKTGLFGTSETFVPISAADVDDNSIRVPFDKATIKDAPRIDVDEHLSPEQEDELYRHYQDVNRQASGGHDDQGGIDEDHGDHTHDGQDGDHNHDDDGHDHDHDGHDHDDAHHDGDRAGDGEGESMVRSEEQVNVGTKRVETGKARLRKYVVTEDVTTTVPVEREEVRLEREPISDGDAGEAVADGDLGDEEQEVTLTEERVTVDKETVPVERVGLGTETVTDDQEVTEEVRKEQVEADLPDGHDDGEGQRNDDDR
ncbi:PRC and DUF2382 domain-containing protein [soil metagenome]